MSTTPRKSPRKTPKKGAGKRKGRSRAARADLIMPVGRIASMLKEGRYARRVGSGAPVFLAAVLEYLLSELVYHAGQTALEHKKRRITPRYLNLAIRNDEELSQLLHSATIAGGGVKPGILKQLRGVRKGEEGKEGRRRKKEKKRRHEKKREKKGKEKRKERGATQEV